MSWALRYISKRPQQQNDDVSNTTNETPDDFVDANSSLPADRLDDSMVRLRISPKPERKSKLNLDIKCGPVIKSVVIRPVVNVDSLVCYRGQYALQFIDNGRFSRKEILETFSQYLRPTAICSHTLDTYHYVYVFTHSPLSLKKAVESLWDRFDSLRAAPFCVLQPLKPNDRIPNGSRDGTFCLTFRNKHRCLSHQLVSEAFAAYGRVVDVRFDNRGNGFVRYRREEEALQALVQLRLCPMAEEDFPGIKPAWSSGSDRPIEEPRSHRHSFPSKNNHLMGSSGRKSMVEVQRDVIDQLLKEMKDKQGQMPSTKLDQRGD